MIRHCVFVKFRPDIGRTERDAIYAGIAALRGPIAGIRRFDAGTNVSPEGLGKGYDEGFIVDFDGPAARDGYIVHPEHQAAAARLVAATAGGADGIMVFDFELPG